VAEYGLQGLQVHPALEEVAGERVAEHAGSGPSRRRPTACRRTSPQRPAGDRRLPWC
jgi:hypothetical protein